MNKQMLQFLAIAVALLMLIVVVAGVMGGGIPKSIRQQFDKEEQHLNDTKKNVSTVKNQLQEFQASYPDYFKQVDQREELLREFDGIEEKLGQTEEALLTRAKPIVEKNDKKDAPALSAELLTVETTLADVTKKQATLQERLTRFRAYRDKTDEIAAAARGAYSYLTTQTLGELQTKITQSQLDWPEKQSDLQQRFDTLKSFVPDALAAWDVFQAEESKGDQMDYLVAGTNADVIIATKNAVSSGTDELSGLVDQLYISYDKLLEDMEIREGLDVEFYHEYKTMTVDRDDKATTKSDWEKVTDSTYKLNENNLGMVIESKPKGKYNSEAIRNPIPPGYNYVGDSRYGSWETDRSGHRQWGYHSHYSYLPLFFYGSSYRSRPITYNDWSTYRTFQGRGQTYYGTSQSGSMLWGSKGDNTKTSYSGSKYYKSGGYSSSKYKQSGGTYRGSRYESKSSSSSSSSKSRSSSNSSSYRGSSSSRSRSSGGK